MVTAAALLYKKLKKSVQRGLMTQRHNERLKQWCNSRQGKLYFSRCLKQNAIIRLHIQRSDSSDEEMSRCWVMRGHKRKSSNNCHWLSGTFYFKNLCPCVKYRDETDNGELKAFIYTEELKRARGQMFYKLTDGWEIDSKAQKDFAHWSRAEIAVFFCSNLAVVVSIFFILLHALL